MSSSSSSCSSSSSSSSHSPSPSATRNWRYDLFVSFRGDDVRKNFLSHFMKEIDKKAISVFIDNKIEKGESLAPVLEQAIKDSRMAIVVFSKQYASSAWCLNELLEIVKCKDRPVIPVFYDVDPAHVRKQSREFGNIFKKTCHKTSKDRIELWQKALTDWENEAKLIEDIVQDILVTLTITPSNDFKDYVGIEEHTREMISLLDPKSKPEEVRMVGIWGASGIGKTTIGRALFNSLLEFPKRIYIDRSFINKSRESYNGCNPSDQNMKLHLQGNFLSKLLGQEGIEANHLGTVKNRLKHQKVLIFIDDVDDQALLDALVGGDDWFGPGSRIIAITKDMQTLRGHGIKYVYKVGIPSKESAIRILCQSAFRKGVPPDDFLELASEVAESVGGLPLGLDILGKHMAGKGKESWKKLLPSLQKGVPIKIKEVLRMSYEGLERKHQALFRHIACFFNGDDFDRIQLMLANSGLDVDAGLENLVDKSLIHVKPSWNNSSIVEMHCLLQEMGKEIVSEQSIRAGEREFLMDSNDVCNVLNGCLGTENVLGISLNLDEIDKVKIDKDAFKGMSNLRFLKIYKTSWERKKEVTWDVAASFNGFSNRLKLLSWPECPMESISSEFSPEYLVELKMPNSKLQKLWDGDKPLKYLKEMDLSESKDLKEIPELLEASNLETLKVYGCSSLVKLPSSIRNLDKLTEVNVTGCSSMEEFPNISNKILSFTANHTAFKIFPTKMNFENLIELRMEGIMSAKLWDGVQPLPSLRKIVLGAESLEEIPNLSMATNLETLNLSGCSSLEVLTHSSIQNLHKLTTLEMIGCSSLKTLPTGINLESLYRLNLNGCLELESFPDISTNISRLDLNQTAITEIPLWITNFSKLGSLDMEECENLETLPTGIDLLSLYRLNLNGCSRLKSFPNFARKIFALFLNKTAIEEVPPWINKFSDLEALEMWECKKLKYISPLLFNLPVLEEAYFSDCKDLKEVKWPEKEEGTTPNMTMINFSNCFDMNQQTFIQRSTSQYLILSQGEMLPYFTHISTGSSVTIPLHTQKSSLDFKACIVVSKGSSTTVEHNLCFFMDIKVQCRFRDTHGNYFQPVEQTQLTLHQTYKFNHQIIFDCHLPLIQECDQVEIEFHLPQGLKLEKCGIRLLESSTPLLATGKDVDEIIVDDDGGYEAALEEEHQTEGSKHRTRQIHQPINAWVSRCIILSVFSLIVSIANKR